MKEFLKGMDDLPKVVKIILALPGLDIIWSVYRVIKAYSKNDQVGMIVWLLLGLFLGWNILAICDIILLVLNDQPLYYCFKEGTSSSKNDAVDVDYTDKKDN
jgi:hypothetical protein